jgi:major membrane immunogen (membrane-anchored lipoprotein)
MKNILAVTLLAFTLLAACKKKDDSKTQQLTSGKWYVKKVMNHQTLPTTTDYDYTPYLKDCAKDDYYQFKGDGSFVLDEGGSKCSPSAVQSFSGKWKLIDGDSKLIFSDMTSTYFDTMSVNINGGSLTMTAPYYEIEDGVSYKGMSEYSYGH